MSRVSACSGVGIYSLKLIYEDGSFSPLFGSRPETTEIEVKGDQVSSVGLRAWKENYVQTVTMKHKNSDTSSLESQSNNGTMKEFKLEKGERVIGVHGYLDQN